MKINLWIFVLCLVSLSSCIDRTKLNTNNSAFEVAKTHQQEEENTIEYNDNFDNKISASLTDLLDECKSYEQSKKHVAKLFNNLITTNHIIYFNNNMHSDRESLIKQMSNSLDTLVFCLARDVGEFKKESVAFYINPAVNPSFISLGMSKVAVYSALSSYSISENRSNQQSKLNPYYATQDFTRQIMKHHFYPVSENDFAHQGLFVYSRKSLQDTNLSWEALANYTMPVRDKSEIGVRYLNQVEKDALLMARDYKYNCPVSVNRLQRVIFPYKTLDMKNSVSSIVVLDVIADNVYKIFVDLYRQNIPIISLGGYNCRNIRQGNSMSLHSYGLAIDVNVYANPYIGGYKPRQSLKYGDYIESTMIPPVPMSHFGANRFLMVGNHNDYMPFFYRYGFQSGADWKSPVDYQHFEIPINVANLLVKANPEHAKILYGLYIKHPDKILNIASQTWYYGLLQNSALSNKFIACLSQYIADIGKDTVFQDVNYYMLTAQCR